MNTMKFVCEHEKPMKNWIIHPGIYDVEIQGEDCFVGVNKFHALKQELLSCGYFNTWKYWMSDAQSDGGHDVNYVLVNGEWLPYSELTTGKEVCNWGDAKLVVESAVELPIEYSGYDWI